MCVKIEGTSGYVINEREKRVILNIIISFSKSVFIQIYLCEFIIKSIYFLTQKSCNFILSAK